jgi:hypothetical protein
MPVPSLETSAATDPGGVVTAEDIALIVLLAFAVLAPPAFLWLGVILERRKTRRK